MNRSSSLAKKAAVTFFPVLLPERFAKRFGKGGRGHVHRPECFGRNLKILIAFRTFITRILGKWSCQRNLLFELSNEALNYSVLGYSILGFNIQYMMLNKDRKRLLRETLKNTRIEKGLRQVDLAEALGRTQSYVAKLEAGEKTLDFIEVLEICKVLRLNPISLIKVLL